MIQNFISNGSQCYNYVCFYTVTVADAAAPASSSQPSTTTKTSEKPSPHVVGMPALPVIKSIEFEGTAMLVYFKFTSSKIQS